MTTNSPFRARDGYLVRPLFGPSYSKNVSISRLVYQGVIAGGFYRAARKLPAPDVILVTLPTIEFCISVALLSRRGIPYVIDIRDLYPDVYELTFPRRFRSVGRILLTPWRVGAAWALHNATDITGVSESYVRWGNGLAGKAPKGENSAIPIGYEGTLSLGRTRVAQPNRRVVAVFTGSFGLTYDLPLVIQAAERLSGILDIVLVGDGVQMPRLRRMAVGLENVRFAGWCGVEELASELESADIGLATYVPNAPQSLPNKLVEYLAAGLPIVNGLSDEAADLVQDAGCGLNYRAGDLDDLCRALTELVHSSALRVSCARAARRVFDSRFDSKVVNRKFVSLMETAANR